MTHEERQAMLNATTEAELGRPDPDPRMCCVGCAGRYCDTCPMQNEQGTNGPVDPGSPLGRKLLEPYVEKEDNHEILTARRGFRDLGVCLR